MLQIATASSPNPMARPTPLMPEEPWPQRVSRVLAWIAGALILFGCSGLITLDVITRMIFRRGVVESFELSGYAFAAAIGFGLAFTATSKANVRVDILLSLLPPGLRRCCDVIAALSLSVIALALAWYGWRTLDQSITMHAKSVSTLQVPMAIPQGIWWVGIFWFACVAVLLPLQAMVRLLRRDRAGFDALIGSPQKSDEIAQAGISTAPVQEPRT